MKIRIENASQFSTLINALSDEIVSAACYFQLFENLLNSIPDYEIVFNQSNTFWAFAIQALLDTTLSHLCRVYDTYQNSLNLRNLLDTIQANLGIFETERFKERLKENPFVQSLSQSARGPDPDTLTRDIESISDTDPLVKKLIKWRHNIIAHKTASNVIKQKDITHDYPITRENISELITRATTILNRYNNLFQATTYSTHSVGADDYSYILKTIKDKIAKDEEKIASEIARYKNPQNQ